MKDDKKDLSKSIACDRAICYNLFGKFYRSTGRNTDLKGENANGYQAGIFKGSLRLERKD